jgi:AbiJ N-terminal domain 4
MSERRRFSDRHGYVPTEAEVTIQHDAPHELRGVVLDIAYEAGLSPSPMRNLVCRVLRTRPDPNNWSEYPNIAGEVEYLVDHCAWFEVYDIIEEIHQNLVGQDDHLSGERAERPSEYFSRELNRYFLRSGIGWQLINGQLQIRGSESFEASVHQAQEALEASGRATARQELHQALLDLSRRPEPDITGAIQHAMAALECVARDVSGDPRATLGEILRRYSGLIPAPLDQAIEKAWGYSSERGRHLREGRNPDMDEAKLVVGLSAVLATYLLSKTGQNP